MFLHETHHHEMAAGEWLKSVRFVGGGWGAPILGICFPFGGRSGYKALNCGFWFRQWKPHVVDRYSHLVREKISRA